MTTTGVFADWLATDQLSDYSHSSISWIFSIYMFFLLVGGGQIGTFVAPSDPRRARLTWL